MNAADRSKLAFEHGGRYFRCVGLLTIQRYLATPDSKFDPPTIKPEILAWVEARGGHYGEIPLTGVPAFSFPTRQDRDDFEFLFIPRDL